MAKIGWAHIALRFTSSLNHIYCWYAFGEWEAIVGIESIEENNKE